MPLISVNEIQISADYVFATHDLDGETTADQLVFKAKIAPRQAERCYLLAIA